MSTIFSIPASSRSRHAAALQRLMGVVAVLCLLTACAAGHDPLPAGRYPVSAKAVAAPPAQPSSSALPTAYVPPPGVRYVTVLPYAASSPSASQPVGDALAGEAPRPALVRPASAAAAAPTPRAIAPAKPRPAPAVKAKAPSTPKAAPTAETTPKTPAAPAPTAASRVAAGLVAFKAPPASTASAASAAVPDCWEPLVDRLKNDPKVTPEVVNYFCNLPTYSPEPMGAKVTELFTNAILRKKSPQPSGPPRRIYKNVVTAANVAKCADFLRYYKSTFAAVEKKYPVPKEILVSLLFVETRLGDVIGKENAFWSLACMAAATTPEHVQGGLGGLPITDQHAAWLQDKLSDKSEWAYKELRALLKFCYIQQLDPRGMPGSVYGAIGLCQFMPSNLVPYGDDGDGDGLVNLFSVPDAVFSAALYLTKHGWQSGISVARQRQTLKRYNNLNIYANTILALAASIRTGRLYDGPPDMVQARAKAKAGKKR
jgi:membrane-bound lytic murein transglycosylase B